MQKTFTKLTIGLSILMITKIQAQTIETFDTYSLSANSYYQNNASSDFGTGGITFQYGWNGIWNGWESGTAYTNMNDTVNGTYANLYGCITGTAFSGNNYATAQSGALITFTNNTTAVSGFYITNTTYAWKTIKKGNMFSRRFGDTTGTGSGTSIAQGQYPDWFKILVRGYRGGNILADSVEYYLADYRATGTINDYAIKNWQFVNCISLGQVDSIRFEMKSSDNSFGFMNTPAFFSLDNFVTVSTVGVDELANISQLSLFPNPASQNAFLNYEAKHESEVYIHIFDVTGKEIQTIQSQVLKGNNNLKLNTEVLESGIYFIEITNEHYSKKIKFIKL
jgi:hypothetical protein